MCGGKCVCVNNTKNQGYKSCQKMCGNHLLISSQDGERGPGGKGQAWAKRLGNFWKVISHFLEVLSGNLIKMLEGYSSVLIKLIPIIAQQKSQ